MNTSEQSLLKMNAAKIGFRFGQCYYSALTTDPGSAYLFYDEIGDYQTIFEDGTSIVAKDWNEINSVLMSRSVTLADFCVKSITTEPVGGSLEHIVITVMGERFYHVMAADYRPDRQLTYAIVKSVKQYLPDANPPTGVTTIEAVNKVPESYNDPEAIEQDHVNFPHDIETDREPSLGIVDISNDTTTVNDSPKRILKRVTDLTGIANSSIPPGYTVKNDACYDETADSTPISVEIRAGEAGYKFATMYYATLSTDPDNAYLFYDELGDYRTEFEDGTTVVAKNRNEMNCVLKRPLKASDIFVTSITAQSIGGSLDHIIITVTGERFYHVLEADYRPDREQLYAIVKSVKHYWPANQTTRVATSDEGAEFDGNDNDPAGIHRGNLSDDIATSTTESRNTVMNDDDDDDLTTENFSISVMTSAAEVGLGFPERCYASLDTYVSKVLKRSVTASQIVVHSVTVEHLGGSMEPLLITVTGKRSLCVPAADNYWPDANPPTGVTTIDAVNRVPESYNDPEAIEQDHVNFPHDIATDREPSLGIVDISTDTTTVNDSPKRILKRVTDLTGIANSSIPPGYTVKNDACYDETADSTPISVETRAAEAGYKFATMYYATLSTDPDNAYLFYDELGDYRTEFEDGTTVVAKNRNEMNCVLKRPLKASDIFVTSITAQSIGGSLDHIIITVTGERFYHVLEADYRPDREQLYAIVKSVKHYWPANQTTRVATSDEGAEFDGNDNDPAGIHRGNLSDDIATSTTESRNTVKNDDDDDDLTTENRDKRSLCVPAADNRPDIRLVAPDAELTSEDQNFPENRRTRVPTIAQGNIFAENNNNREPAGIPQGNLSDDISTYCKLSRSITLNTRLNRYSENFTVKNLPRLKRVIGIDTTPIPSRNAVKMSNDIYRDLTVENTSSSVKTSATKVGLGFPKRRYAWLDAACNCIRRWICGTPANQGEE